MTELRISDDDVFTRRTREQWTEQLGRRLEILVAGCGRGADLYLERVEAHVTGVDEDLPMLRVRTETREDLDVWTLGDLRAVPLTPRSFDVVRCDFLLERIRHTELVLDRLVAALRPGGLLLLRMRDRQSAYGFCDRLLPSRVRTILWPQFAPPDEVGPLPAIYEQVASREGINAYCLMRGLMIAEEYTGSSGPARRGQFGNLVARVCTTVDQLSRGRLPAVHDEITYVIRKPQNHFARLI